MVELGRALNTLNDPPVKALFVYNSNPAAVCPEHNEVVRGLLRPDLFTVVHEQFFTDTTDYADIVLPATTFFEHKDLQKAYGHYYLQVSNQAIAPLGECRSNVEVFRALAERMGFDEECFRESVDEMIDLALDSEDPWMEGINRERLGAGTGAVEPCGSGRLRASRQRELRSGQPGRLSPHEQSHFCLSRTADFRTPSGKAELYSEALKAQGLDPVADFTPPIGVAARQEENAFPLELLARKADNFLNSTFTNVPSVQEMEEQRPAGNFRGRCSGAGHRRWRPGARVQSSRRYSAEGASGWQSAAGSCLREPELGEDDSRIPEHQRLTSEKLTDMGNSATFYSVLVEVELSKPSREATDGLDDRRLQIDREELRFGRFPVLYRIMTVFSHPRG